MTLTTKALSNLDRAYALLGHHPGPGYDIAISPTRPVSAAWLLEGRTHAGKAYLGKILGSAKAEDNRHLQQIKLGLTEWGLSFYTDWNCVQTIRHDP